MCFLPKKLLDPEMKIENQQECIPVGCVLNAAVTTTRCHYRGVCPIPPDAEPLWMYPLIWNQPTPPPLSWTKWLADASENITFPYGRKKTLAFYELNVQISIVKLALPTE